VRISLTYRDLGEFGNQNPGPVPGYIKVWKHNFEGYNYYPALYVSREMLQKGMPMENRMLDELLRFFAYDFPRFGGK
jgi:hypothetical protein